MTDTTILDRARDALVSHEWTDAYDAFTGASQGQALAGEDLEKLSEAAWWTAHPAECIDALERAYAIYSSQGNQRRAAYVALNLADQWNERLRSAQAAAYDAPLWHASAHQALGEVLMYEGDLRGAIVELRKAVHHWTEADLPYETAQARRCLALAHRSDDDEASAVLELRSALAMFEELGAALEAERCLEMIRAGEATAGRRVTRTFLFTDIVGSTNLLETIGDEAWEDVLRWHDETLRSAIESHGGEIVHPTGDGYFATFEDAGSAATSAVAIQQRLAEHRRKHGFAPQVRIGVARCRGDGDRRRLRRTGRAPGRAGRRTRRGRGDRGDV